MELKDVFKGRWLVAVIVLPTIAAGVAGSASLALAPQLYEAHAVVSVKELSVPSGSSTPALIDDFDSALGGPRAQEAVAEAEERDTAFGLIEAAAVGNGADVEVSYRSDSVERALEGLEAGVREALLILSNSELRQAERRFVASREVADAATEDMQSLEERVGVADLREEVARRSADILTLRNQIASSVGTPFEVALTQVLAEKTDELRTIEAQLLPWEEGRSRFDRALSLEAESALEVAQAEAIVTDIVSGEVLRTPQVIEVSPVMGFLRAAIGAGLAVGAAIVAIALTTGPGGRRTHDTPLDGSPGPNGRAVRAARGNGHAVGPEPQELRPYRGRGDVAVVEHP